MALKITEKMGRLGLKKKKKKKKSEKGVFQGVWVAVFVIFLVVIGHEVACTYNFMWGFGPEGIQPAGGAVFTF